MKFTSDQQKAIDARNNSVLVSAAAGSGKTAVLTERVMDIIRKGFAEKNPALKARASLKHMLIVTFTRAAAAEMRGRIQLKLRDEIALCSRKLADLERNAALDGTDAILKGKDYRLLKRYQSYLSEQESALQSAHISTLHVFCLYVIRRFFRVSGIDPMSTIGDSARLDDLLEKSIEQVLTRVYQQPTAEEQALMDAYEDGQIEDMILSVRRYAMSLPDPEKWLKNSGTPLENLNNYAPFSDFLNAHIAAKLDNASALNDAFCACVAGWPKGIGTVEDVAIGDGDLIAELRSNLKAGKKLTKPSYKTLRFTVKKGMEPVDESQKQRATALRDAFKEELKALLALYPDEAGENGDDPAAVINLAAPAIRGLCGIVLKVNQKYSQLKRKRNLLDYNDLEQLCYKVLTCENEEEGACRQLLMDEFSHIMVDEYQDVSGIQSAIIDQIHGGENYLFMVGDVKQSIYRFRLADPGLFQQAYADFSFDDGAIQRKIVLQQNFRSDKNVLNAVNSVFSAVMQGGEMELNYDDQAKLYPGEGALDGPECDLYLVKPAENENVSRETIDEDEDDAFAEADDTTRAEAMVILEIVRKLCGRETYPARSEEGDQQDIVDKRYHPRDIAILLRKKKSAAYYAEELQKAGFAAYTDADDSFFRLPAVQDVVNLLRAIDNLSDDRYLLAALRLPLFHFTGEELGLIRLEGLKMQKNQPPSDPETGKKKRQRLAFHQAFALSVTMEGELGDKIRAFKAQMNAWKELSRFAGLQDFIWQIMTESGLYALCGGMDDGSKQQANLRLLCQNAAGFDTLSGFLRHVDGLCSQSDDQATAKSLGANEDVIRIMTIHKSKGLQFPAVILPEMGRSLAGKSDQTPVRCDKEFGVLLNAIDPRERTKSETALWKAAVERGKMQSQAEEARMLYVAMTRAEHKLILLGSPASDKKGAGGFEKKCAEWSMAAGTKAGCMLDWVCPRLSGALEGQKDGAFTGDGVRWRIFFRSKEMLEKSAVTQKKPKIKLDFEAPDRQTTADFEQKQPPLYPIKTSVSALSHTALDESEEETPPTKRIPGESGPGRSARQDELEKSARPLFKQEKSTTLNAAERGSAMHKALCGIDLKQARGADIKTLVCLVDELQQKGKLTAAQRKAVDVRKIHHFLGSELGLRLTGSEEIHREWRFNYRPTPEDVREIGRNWSVNDRPNEENFGQIGQIPWDESGDCRPNGENVEQIGHIGLDEPGDCRPNEENIGQIGQIPWDEPGDCHPSEADFGDSELEKAGLLLPGQTMLQGVIDACFMEQGGWVLVDYKTDYVPSEYLLDGNDTRVWDLSVLKKRYAGQVIWYARALEKLTGRPVRHIYLYSIHAGDWVEVERGRRE